MAVQRKGDMVAFKTLKEELKTPLEKIGHIRGFKAGDKFRFKGELAITGIHCNIAAGIYAKCAHKPCVKWPTCQPWMYKHVRAFVA